MDTRVVIEQAKGYLARALSIDMDTAREVLRRYARTHQQRLTDVASAVAQGNLPLEALDVTPNP